MALGALAGSCLFKRADVRRRMLGLGLELASLFWIQSALILVTVLPLLVTMYELPIRNTGVAGDIRHSGQETQEFMRHDGVWIH